MLNDYAKVAVIVHQHDSALVMILYKQTTESVVSKYLHHNITFVNRNLKNDDFPNSFLHKARPTEML